MVMPFNKFPQAPGRQKAAAQPHELRCVVNCIQRAKVARS